MFYTSAGPLPNVRIYVFTKYSGNTLRTKLLFAKICSASSADFGSLPQVSRARSGFGSFVFLR